MKLSPNKITQAEGVTQKKINALVGGGGGREGPKAHGENLLIG